MEDERSVEIIACDAYGDMCSIYTNAKEEILNSAATENEKADALSTLEMGLG